MNNISAILKKELKTYFNSPIAFITIATFLIITSWLFFYNGDYHFFAIQTSDIRNLFNYGAVVMLFIAPAISMRLISEEKYNGTLELLVTMPIDDWEIILGKYLSTVTMYFIIILGMLVTPITVMMIGDPEIGVILTSYIGFFLLGATYLAIGLAASAFTKNQIVAFIITVIILSVLYFIGNVTSGSSVIAEVFNYLSVHTHFQNFFKGVIDMRDIMYFLSITVISLAIASAALSSRKFVK